MTIIEFLEARIDEDMQAFEKVARVVNLRPDLKSHPTNTPARHVAELVAKRAIVDRHQPDRALENWYWSQRKCAECGGAWHKYVSGALPTDIGPEQGCATLRALASIYADHPDYKTEWQV